MFLEELTTKNARLFSQPGIFISRSLLAIDWMRKITEAYMHMPSLRPARRTQSDVRLLIPAGRQP